MKKSYHTPSIRAVKIATASLMAKSFDINGTAGVEAATGGTPPTYGASRRYTIFDDGSIFDDAEEEYLDY